MINKVLEVLKTQGYADTWVYIALYGSQNYGLQTPESDYDYKVLVMPTLNNILKGKFVSKVYKYEHGQIEVKDIRLYLSLWTKANPSYLEILNSTSFIINNEHIELMNKILEIKYQIAEMNLIGLYNATCGMAYEKRKALTHPYPSIADKIEKFGYDPKQLHHIVRLWYILLEVSGGINYLDAFDVTPQLVTPFIFKMSSKLQDELLEYKFGKYTLKDAQQISDTTIKSMKALKDDLLKNKEISFNQKTYDRLEKIIFDGIKGSIMNIYYFSV